MGIKSRNESQDKLARQFKQEGQHGTAGYAGFLMKRQEHREAVRAVVVGMLLAEHSPGGWRGTYAVPPASALERVLSAFRQETNIPLELPFFAFLHFVSGLLLQRGSKIAGPVGELAPELWTVVLAPSGAGKTWAVSVLEEAAGLEGMAFTEPASGAAFLEALAQKSPALWTQDEIAQKLKQIETPNSPLSDAKEYLLRTYDNKPLERKRVRGEPLRVEKPILGILGLNTPESFRKALSAESLLDGFAQRFGFVWAEKDPNRPMRDFPIYDKPKVLAACAKAFEQVKRTQLHDRYTIGPEAAEAFSTSFALLDQRADMPESYFRRSMFRAFRYAVLYHVILGKEGSEIDAEDIGWGARVVSLHLADMGKVLGRDDEFRASSEVVAKATRLKERLDQQGKPFDPRAIQMGLREVKGADQARVVYETVMGKEAPGRKRTKANQDD